MKVTYLKTHNGKEEGDTGEVSEGIGQYLVKVGAAKEKKEKKEVDKEKKEITVSKEKKQIDKP